MTKTETVTAKILVTSGGEPWAVETVRVEGSNTARLVKRAEAVARDESVTFVGVSILGVLHSLESLRAL